MLELDAHVEDASNDSEDGCECLTAVGGRFAHGLVYSWKDPLLSQGGQSGATCLSVCQHNPLVTQLAVSIRTDMSFNDDA
jgi:hypothetical protein